MASLDDIRCFMFMWFGLLVYFALIIFGPTPGYPGYKELGFFGRTWKWLNILPAWLIGCACLYDYLMQFIVWYQHWSYPSLYSKIPPSVLSLGRNCNKLVYSGPARALSTFLSSTAEFMKLLTIKIYKRICLDIILSAKAKRIYKLIFVHVFRVVKSLSIFLLRVGMTTALVLARICSFCFKYDYSATLAQILSCFREWSGFTENNGDFTKFALFVSVGLVLVTCCTTPAHPDYNKQDFLSRICIRVHATPLWIVYFYAMYDYAKFYIELYNGKECQTIRKKVQKYVRLLAVASKRLPKGLSRLLLNQWSSIFKCNLQALCKLIVFAAVGTSAFRGNNEEGLLDGILFHIHLLAFGFHTLHYLKALIQRAYPYLFTKVQEQSTGETSSLLSFSTDDDEDCFYDACEECRDVSCAKPEAQQMDAGDVIDSSHIDPQRARENLQVTKEIEKSHIEHSTENRSQSVETNKKIAKKCLTNAEAKRKVETGGVLVKKRSTDHKPMSVLLSAAVTDDDDEDYFYDACEEWSDVSCAKPKAQQMAEGDDIDSHIDPQRARENLQVTKETEKPHSEHSTENRSQILDTNKKIAKTCHTNEEAKRKVETGGVLVKNRSTNQKPLSVLLSAAVTDVKVFILVELRLSSVWSDGVSVCWTPPCNVSLSNGVPSFARVLLCHWLSFRRWPGIAIGPDNEHFDAREPINEHFDASELISEHIGAIGPISEHLDAIETNNEHLILHEDQSALQHEEVENNGDISTAGLRMTINEHVTSVVVLGGFAVALLVLFKYLR